MAGYSPNLSSTSTRDRKAFIVGPSRTLSALAILYTHRQRSTCRQLFEIIMRWRSGDGWHAYGDWNVSSSPLSPLNRSRE
jgi:hypothetical protein